ncbi:dihydroorotate dehydrogenase electron transfer subunit [Pullulanibacillus sp. KACC 23026]|uniref:dihydroorotate dehydrogenase electron transfer subunit n=1 Tax=Pullulanibacillus sp. KACC 23026 TaxID=3028315 RepID=UPI0023B0550B|nr:dihydroorotate dehydrogenase electron transfer subunit [Pullulanibacillus sp. KACC 23026]WEG15003.1 dihydroorotate dehydrogenase electron transfer subunit [Pullulanibacillus sp. KACC 23026]
MEIVSNEGIAKDIFKLIVRGSLAKEVQEPGKFFHIKVGEGLFPLLRRPISLCDVNHEREEVTMIYRAEGDGTKALAKLQPGILVDVLGPLGHGFPVDEVPEGGHALLVGGGVGVPPLFLLSKMLRARGVSVTHVLGFQSEPIVFYENEFKTLGPTYIATVDGTHGTKGFVTTVMEQESLTFDTLFACGPIPMLKALEADYGNQPVYLSLEQRMGCGIGACLACVCHTKEDSTGASYKKVCTDGPVFRAGEVVLS